MRTKFNKYKTVISNGMESFFSESDASVPAHFSHCVLPYIAIGSGMLQVQLSHSSIFIKYLFIHFIIKAEEIRTK